MASLFQKKRHDPRESGSDESHAQCSCDPFLFLVLCRDIWSEIFRTQNDPVFGMAYSVFINQDTVDQIHNGQDHKTLPETRPKATCSVEHVHADEHVDQIARKAQASKAHTLFPDFFSCRQAKFNNSYLYLQIVKMDHTDSPVAYAKRADKI